jgi:maleylpyruvate isomerase
MAQRPVEDVRRVDEAQERFDAAIAWFGEAEVRAPCALPDWTVGHLLTHVARNADSHVLRVHGAERGEVVDQYPGGFEGRARAIEDGASRPADVLIEDVRTSAAALSAAWAVVPDDAWGRVTRDVGGRERPLADLVGRRWQELEVHLIDLGGRRSPRDWPDPFVQAWLPRLRAELPHRLPAGTGPPTPGTLDERDELAWLYGRLDRSARPDLAGLAGLAELGPWS